MILSTDCIWNREGYSQNYNQVKKFVSKVLLNTYLPKCVPCVAATHLRSYSTYGYSTHGTSKLHKACIFHATRKQKTRSMQTHNADAL